MPTKTSMSTEITEPTKTITIPQDDYINNVSKAFAEGMTLGICKAAQISKFSAHSFWGREVLRAETNFRKGLAETLATAQPAPQTIQ